MTTPVVTPVAEASGVDKPLTQADLPELVKAITEAMKKPSASGAVAGGSVASGSDDPSVSNGGCSWFFGYCLELY